MEESREVKNPLPRAKQRQIFNLRVRAADLSSLAQRLLAKFRSHLVKQPYIQFAR